MPTVQVRTPGNLFVDGGSQDKKWKLSDENIGNDTNFCEEERYCEGRTGEKVHIFLEILNELMYFQYIIRPYRFFEIYLF